MKHILFLFALFFLFSCNEKRNTQDQLETITIDLNKEDFFVKEPAFLNYSYIKLETNSECLLSEISKVICHNDKIYIISITEPTVFIFNKQGKFISKISRGQGPGEVIFVSDINIKDQYLYVLDMYKTLKKYDLNGNYIEDELKFDLNYFSFAFVPSIGTYAIDCNINKTSDYNIYLYTDAGEEKTFIKKEDWSRQMPIMTLNLFKNNYFTWPLSNIIYKVNSENGELEPIYEVDFGGKGINSQEFEKPLTGYGKCGEEDYAWWVKDFLKTKDGFYFSFKYKEVYFVKKKNGSTKVYSNLIKNLPKMSSSVGYGEDMLIFTCKSYELINYSELHKDDILSDEIYKEEIDETDNPFLIFLSIDE